MIRCCRKGWWENRQLPPLASARVPLASDVNTPPCITQLWKHTSVYNTTVRENKTVKTQLHVNSEIEPLSNTTEKTQLPQHDRHQCPLGLCCEHNSVWNTTVNPHSCNTQQWDISQNTDNSSWNNKLVLLFLLCKQKKTANVFIKTENIVVLVVIIIYARHNTFVPAFNKCPKQGSRFSIRERSGDSFSCPCGRHPETYLSHRKRNTFVFASR